MSARLHNRNQDEQHLKQIEMAWDDALARCDADSLSQLLTDDYEVTDINGDVHNKPRILEAVASIDPQLKPYHRDDVDVRIDGNTAVITGRITWRNGNGNGYGNGNGNGNGNGHARVRARYLKVDIRRDDGWKALVARATRIRES